MGILPNILPAHPEAPEWLIYPPKRRTGLIGRVLHRIKARQMRRRDLRALRKLSDPSLKDLGLHRSGLKTAHFDRMALAGQDATQNNGCQAG